jgi:hypothetical protein
VLDLAIYGGDVRVDPLAGRLQTIDGTQKL